MIPRAQKLLNILEHENEFEELEIDTLLSLKTIALSQKTLLPKLEERQKKLKSLMQQMDKAIGVPDAANYKEWGLNEIMLWILSLEDGRFQKYLKGLMERFETNKMRGSDLPYVSRQDLDISFKIAEFRDRLDLEGHFQALGQPPKKKREK